MKRIHLLRVASDAADWTLLQDATRALGGRLGRLDWRPEEKPVGLPTEDPSGWSRRVTLEAGRATAIKPMAGPPVLRDVLREYFGGCWAVLVSSSASIDGAIAEVRPVDDGFEVQTLSEVEEPRRLRLSADELAHRLRRPRPFAAGSPAGAQVDSGD